MWVLIAVAVPSLLVLAAVVMSLHTSFERTTQRLQPVADAVNRAAVCAAIERAGSAEKLIRAALREADDAIERAHRAGEAFAPGSATPALLKARRGYARSEDEVLDALRALTLAHEADEIARRRVEENAPFDAWLRDYGDRLLR